MNGATTGHGRQISFISLLIRPWIMPWITFSGLEASLGSFMICAMFAEVSLSMLIIMR